MFYDEWDLENGHEHDLSIALAAAATSDGFRHNRRNPKKSFLTLKLVQNLKFKLPTHGCINSSHTRYIGGG